MKCHGGATVAFRDMFVLQSSVLSSKLAHGAQQTAKPMAKHESK